MLQLLNARDRLWDARNVHASIQLPLPFFRHGCMNSILCQTYAIDAVLGISGHPPNHLTWIEILEFQVMCPSSKRPISLSRTLPDRSVSLSESSNNSRPAPSATTIKACPAEESCLGQKQISPFHPREPNATVLVIRLRTIQASEPQDRRDESLSLRGP